MGMNDGPRMHLKKAPKLSEGWGSPQRHRPDYRAGREGGSQIWDESFVSKEEITLE